MKFMHVHGKGKALDIALSWNTIAVPVDPCSATLLKIDSYIAMEI
jgi:hypothetical protein